MEKIIDRILLKLSPKEFNIFCNKHAIDKSNRFNFKDSLTKLKDRLTSERDKIFIPDSKIIMGDNPITQWGEFYSKHRKTERVYPRGTDIEKVKSDSKRKKELSRDIFLIDEMLQIVDLYPEKESSQIKETQSLVNGESSTYAKESLIPPDIITDLQKLNNFIEAEFKKGIPEKKLKGQIGKKLSLLYKEKINPQKDKRDFLKSIFDDLRFPFKWEYKNFESCCYKY